MKSRILYSFGVPNFSPFPRDAKDIIALAEKTPRCFLKSLLNCARHFRLRVLPPEGGSP